MIFSKLGKILKLLVIGRIKAIPSRIDVELYGIGLIHRIFLAQIIYLHFFIFNQLNEIITTVVAETSEDLIGERPRDELDWQSGI